MRTCFAAVAVVVGGYVGLNNSLLGAVGHSLIAALAGPRIRSSPMTAVECAPGHPANALPESLGMGGRHLGTLLAGGENGRGLSGVCNHGLGACAFSRFSHKAN